MPKSHLYLLRSRYYIHRIDAAHGRRLLVPHEFASVTEATAFMHDWKKGFFARKPEYTGFLIDRGSTLIDAGGPLGALPLEPYIPARAEPVPA